MGGDVKVIRETNRLPDQRKRNSRESGGEKGKGGSLGPRGGGLGSEPSLA